MKGIETVINEVRDRMVKDLGEDSFDNASPYAIAEWIVLHYKPQVEWDEIPPDKDELHPLAVGDLWFKRARVIVAGNAIEYRVHVTAEKWRTMTRHQSSAFIDSIRKGLARELVKFLDQEEGS